MKAKKLPTILTNEEVKSVLNTFNKKTKTGFRNYVLLFTLLNTGMRIKETVLAKYENIREVTNNAGETVHYYRVASENSKTKREKDVPIKESVYRLMKELKKMYGHSKSDFIFTPVSKDKETKKFIPINMGYVRRTFSIHGKLAGVNKNFHPHLTRHFFGSTLYQKTGDILLVKEALYHASITSTECYTHIAPDSIMRAANLIDLE